MYLTWPFSLIPVGSGTVSDPFFFLMERVAPRIAWGSKTKWGSRDRRIFLCFLKDGSRCISLLFFFS